MRKATQNRLLIVAMAVGFGMFLGVAAEAALTVTTATIDFRSNGSETVTIRASLDGITQPQTANELVVTVVISNTTTGEQVRWEGSPTAVR